MKVAVFGASGWVGSRVVQELEGFNDTQVVGVTRDGPHIEGTVFDVVVNAACPSQRWSAEQDPWWDFQESVRKTEMILTRTRWSRFVQISSLSARAELDTVYGRHRLAGEALVPPGRGVVVRLGPMYGPRGKGALFDMMADRPVYATRDTRYGYVDVSYAAAQVMRQVFLDTAGVVEIGPNGWVELGEIADALGSTSRFVGRRADQYVPSEVVGEDVQAAVMWKEWWRPSARDVIAWAKENR